MVTLWAVVGLLLILAEFVVPQFVVFFFGLGALLNALLVAIVPGLAARFPLQLVVWAGTSTLSLVLLRRYAARWFRGGDGSDHNKDEAGTSATVIEAITPDHPGRVRYNGTSWRAITFDETIPVGALVTVLKRDNLELVVTAENLLGKKEQP